jgi:hypothetical protein
MNTVSDHYSRDGFNSDQPPPSPSLQLAKQLAQELVGTATVEIDNVEIGIVVTVTPTNPHGRRFGWMDFAGQLVVEVGDYGGRWELEARPEDLAFLEDIARSVIAGRVREVFALGRSSVSVTLADGSVATETGYQAPAGCLPLPFWRRWSRSVRYAPYR